MEFLAEVFDLDGDIAQSEAMWAAVSVEETLPSRETLTVSGTGSWASTSSDIEDQSVHRAMGYLGYRIPKAMASGSLQGFQACEPISARHGVISPFGSFAGSPSNPHFLENAMRSSSLRAGSPSAAGASRQMRLGPPWQVASSSLVPTPMEPSQMIHIQNSQIDTVPMASAWSAAFLPASRSGEWPHISDSQMFSGVDELDAHAAAVLAGDFDALADPMQHEEAATPLPDPADFHGMFSSPAPSHATMKASSPLSIRVAETASQMQIHLTEPIKSENIPRSQEWGMPSSAPLSGGTSIDTFITRTGFAPLNTHHMEDSDDPMLDSDASPAVNPRGGSRVYASEDEWTPACLKPSARRPRSVNTRVDVPAGSEMDAGRSCKLTGVPRRGAGARVPGSYAAMAYDSEAGDDMSEPNTPLGHRRGSGKRRSPGLGNTSPRDPTDDDGNPRHKRHNPWSVSETEALVDGVEQCGGAGRWQEIKRLEYHALTQRSAVDLKDKWRNLLRVANLPSLHSNIKGDKKREAPSAEILTRVRLMAALGPAKARRSVRSVTTSSRSRPRSRPTHDME